MTEQSYIKQEQNTKISQNKQVCTRVSQKSYVLDAISRDEILAA